MSFPASVKGPGSCMGTPDVCNTPTPAGPVPTPYPNMGECAMVNPATASLNVLFANQNACTTQSEITMTSGDEAGAAGGVVSGMIKGTAKFMLGSMIVKVNGSPCARLMSTVTQNGSPNGNVLNGMQIAPGVPTVLVNG
jgi:hypothetical protein